MRDPREWHAIYFVLDGKDYAYRSWPSVPRVGEHVMFHLKDGPVVHEVVRVVWNTSDDSQFAPTVNVNLKSALDG